jgi:hypothetical protein
MKFISHWKKLTSLKCLHLNKLKPTRSLKINRYLLPLHFLDKFYFKPHRHFNHLEQLKFMFCIKLENLRFAKAKKAAQWLYNLFQCLRMSYLTWSMPIQLPSVCKLRQLSDMGMVIGIRSIALWPNDLNLDCYFNKKCISCKML